MTSDPPSYVHSPSVLIADENSSNPILRCLRHRRLTLTLASLGLVSFWFMPLHLRGAISHLSSVDSPPLSFRPSQLPLIAFSHARSG